MSFGFFFFVKMSFGFLKIYTKEYYQNNQVMKFTVYVYSRIITNFILYFSEVAIIFYDF
jgi:hypothetical protein